MSTDRQPKGVPVGGQFRATGRQDASVSLGEEGPDRPPAQVDGELAEIYVDMERVSRHLADRISRVHRKVGDRGTGRSKTQAPWSMTFEEAWAKLEEQSERSEYAKIDMEEQRSAIAQLREQQDELELRAAPGEQQWETHRWPRFFAVPGGHVHSSRSCSTCRPTTQFTWPTHLSGKTEEEAVGDLGPLLCTVCFPSAPIEWTVGIKKDDDDKCPGSGGHYEEPVRWFGRSRYGTCPSCGERHVITAGGVLRKHRKKG